MKRHGKLTDAGGGGHAGATRLASSALKTMLLIVLAALAGLGALDLLRH